MYVAIVVFPSLIPYQATHSSLRGNISDNILKYMLKFIYSGHALLAIGVVLVVTVSVFLGWYHWHCPSNCEATMRNTRNYCGATMWHETFEGWYQRPSIYHGHIQHDSAHRPTLTVAKLCTHERHPIPRPYGWAMGCLSWVTQRKMTAIFRECTVIYY